MFGEPTPAEPERLALCEINVSSVVPFPPSAIELLVTAAKARLVARSP